MKLTITCTGKKNFSASEDLKITDSVCFDVINCGTVALRSDNGKLFKLGSLWDFCGEFITKYTNEFQYDRDITNQLTLYSGDGSVINSLEFTINLAYARHIIKPIYDVYKEAIRHNVMNNWRREIVGDYE